MATKAYKPTTPGRRGMTVPSFDEVTKFSPEKKLLSNLKKHAGRNNYGRITVRHHGGGNKVKYRLIDFKRSTEGVAKVIGVEYDPNRTDPLEIFVENDKIILKKYSPCCIFCGNGDEVTYYKGKLICRDCLEALKSITAF